MRKGNLLQSIMIVLLIFFLTTSCQEENKKSGNVILNNAQQIDDNLADKLAAIDSNTNEPSQKIKQLIQLYLNEPLEARLSIYKPIFTKLFVIAYSHPDSTVLFFYQQQSKENQQYPNIVIEALLRQASYELFINQKAENGMQSLINVKDYSAHFNDTTYASYYSLYAQTMLQKGDMQKAANYFLQAIALAEKTKDSSSMISNYGNLAVVYSQMNENTKAILLTSKCLDYFIAQRDTSSMFVGNVGLGRAFATIGKIDSSFIYYNKALDLLEAGVRNPSVEIILYTNLGEIYAGKGAIRKAIYYYDLCKKPLKEIGSEDQYRIYTIFSSVAYAHVRDVSEEIEALKENITSFIQNNDLINVRASYSTLYEIASIKKQADNALKFYKLYDSIDDILASNANKKYTLDLQTKYETQRKEVKIQIQEKELTKKAAFNNALILLLIILGVTTAFLITRNRLKVKRRETLMLQQFTIDLLAKTEEERERIARDLHDGLGQELLILKNQITSGLQIAPTKIDHILNEVRTISRNIHPVMLDQIGFKESILHICNQISESEQLFISIDIEYEGNFSKEKELQLFRIIQEALNNIIKYASAHAAKLQITEEDKRLIVIIQDNGKGFDVDAALKGRSAFGLLSILERSKAIHGKASIVSDTKGTIVKIEIPLDNG